MLDIEGWVRKWYIKFIGKILVMIDANIWAIRINIIVKDLVCANVIEIFRIKSRDLNS